MPKDSSQIRFSILMLSIPSRLDKYKKLQDKLLGQIGDREDVEVLCLIDNKAFHIYEKRNELLQMARGSYIAFLDDDDDVSDDYIEEIMNVITIRTDEWDVIAFDQMCDIDGKSCRVWSDIRNPHEPVRMKNESEYHDCLRPPYHWCVWRTELAQSEKFVAHYHETTGQSCEDIHWLARLYPKVLRQYKIEKCLHIYQWSPDTTESILKEEVKS